ncbi:MAG: hypothetical protein COC01_01490 [Bacteroidetes bacterium]|nr:MAG: hypothetical protein COC01_01490 [Bacteroidota bacterium]
MSNSSKNFAVTFSWIATILLNGLACAQLNTSVIKITRTDTLIYDKSNIFSSPGSYLISQPNTIEEVKQVIRYAQSAHKRIIIRGNGHSANGSSIPNGDEIVVLSANFSKITLLSDTVAEVGSGVIMDDFRKYLNKRGYEPIVINEGGKGPTLGGYISAGGIGDDGKPGFWETVISVTLINGKGEEVILSRKDNNFKWLFGSMGQLGFIAKAIIKIRKTHTNEVYQNSNEENIVTLGKKFYWYPMFFSVSEMGYYQKKMERLIADIKNRCHLSDSVKVMFNKGGLRIEFQEFNPPLLYPDTGSFIVLGIKNLLPAGEDNFNVKINCVRSNADEFIRSNKIHTYYQVSYYRQSKEKLLEYLGPEVYSQFKEIKARFDPYNVFGTKIF